MLLSLHFFENRFFEYLWGDKKFFVEPLKSKKSFDWLKTKLKVCPLKVII